MMRGFIALLLLVVVFLSGLLIGIDRQQSTHTIISNEPHATEQTIFWKQEEQGMPMPEQQNVYESKRGTQKMAAFLEDSVKGFYEVVVGVLFQITSLFV